MNEQQPHRDFVEFTRSVWQARVGRLLTHHEARQLTANAAGFFGLLQKWAQAETAPSSSGGFSGTAAHANERAA